MHTDGECEPDVGSDIASESEHDDDDLLEHGGRKGVRTPASVWDAHKKKLKLATDGGNLATGLRTAMLSFD